MSNAHSPQWLQRPVVALALAVLAGLLLRPAIGPEPGGLWIWIAPLPLLLLALHLERASLAHLATLLGAVVAASAYTRNLRLVMPTAPALLATVGMAATWWFVITGTRRIVLRQSRPWVLLAYPALWAALDLAMGRLLPDGQWGSPAYSQSEFLPLLQTVALGGTPALLFALSAPVSALAIALTTPHSGRQRAITLGIGLLIPALAIGYGALRLQDADLHSTPSLRVGLASIDDAVGLNASPAYAGAILTSYETLIKQLADQRPQLVVLPEKIAVLHPDAAMAWQVRFSELARRHELWLEVGVGIDDGHAPSNHAWLFGPDGRLQQDFEKLRLAPPERIEGYRHGDALALQDLAGTRVGLAICKDMHFASVGRRYGQEAVGMMLVPAWDFAYVDAWMGARMTVVRGVENGYTIVRSAREGLLTASDRWGRIIAERHSAPSTGSTLLADVPVSSSAPTLYSHVGDLFGILCLLAALAFWFLPAAHTRLPGRH